MRKIFLLATIISCMVRLSYSQSSEINYIITKIYTDKTTNTTLDQIQYFDGFGQPVQTVQKEITPDKEDLVTVNEYDIFGRNTYSWLPLNVKYNYGSYVQNYLFKETILASTLYDRDSNPYTQQVYENSSRNKENKTIGPGSDWHSTNTASAIGVKTEHIVSQGEFILKHSIIGSGVSEMGLYGAGALYGLMTTTEDGRTTYEYTDKSGRTTLIRQTDNTINYDTYFVYDNFGNLRYVLPPRCMIIRPEGIRQPHLDDLAYQYRYDHRNRCVAKKLPGCDWIHYVYDKSDQLVFSQDGEQRRKGLWMFSINDVLGRSVLSGICNDTLNIQNSVVKAHYTGSGPYEGYNITINGTTQSLNGSDLYTVNFYDNYKFINDILARENNLTIADFEYDNSKETQGFDKPYDNAKTLLTGTITSTFGSNTLLYSVIYYDNRNRIIQSRSTNHLGGLETEYFAYNFTGQPIKTFHSHKKSRESNVTNETYTYLYDHAGRLTETRHKLDNQAEIILSKNEYDKLGRIQKVNKGSATSLPVNYSYNIRSWIKSISNPLFSQNMYYNEQENGNIPSYEGNISRIDWTINGNKKSYNYTYDPLSRLTAADYLGTNTNEKFSTSYSYDSNGNMLTLTRHGKKGAGNSAGDYGIIDQLTFTYQGNQLKTVTDAITDVIINESADFKGNATGDNHYSFNSNGAMSRDLNKGIDTIQYNSLNLPQEMVINNPYARAKNYYTYTASGVKLRTEQRYDPNLLTTPIIGTSPGNDGLSASKVTDYIGNKIYENGNLKKLLFDGGYYDIPENKYYFYLQDHLGNNRVVADKEGNVAQRNDYYPFGMEFADNSGNNQPYKYNDKELDKMHGLNLYDYSARYYDGILGRFTTMDPMAEKYYSWSPYVYCMNNPLKYVDLKGDSLTLVGTPTDIQATVDIHNVNVGPFYNVTVNSSGVVSKTSIFAKYGEQMADAFDALSQSLMTSEQIAYANALGKVVNGAGMTTINIVNNSESVLIGLASTATIDIGDIQKIGNGNVSSTTTLMHETWEQYRMQVGGIDINSAHFQAIGVENSISGQQSLGATIQYDYQNPRTGATSPTGTITIPFINNNTTIIKFRNNNIVTPIIR